MSRLYVALLALGLSAAVLSVGLPAISTQILSGAYCLLLYDVGSFTTTVSYTVTVSHPQ